VAELPVNGRRPHSISARRRHPGWLLAGASALRTETARPPLHSNSAKVTVMKNQVAKGDSINVTLSGPVNSGDGVLVGSLFGVAAVNGATNDTIVLALVGVFTLPKSSAEAWTVGATIYWNNTSKVATTTVASNTKIGVAAAAAANPSLTGVVRLNGTF
jgi:predicted RecA/RadA family phage recombinase